MRSTSPALRAAAGGLALLAVGLPGPWGGDSIPAARGTPASGVPGDAERGRRLFRRYDCVRCHSEVHGGRGTNLPPSLESAGSRARAAWMAEFLLDPEPLRFEAEGRRPGIRMPRIPMSPDDAVDLAAYLAAQRDTVLVPEWTAGAPGDSLVARGAVLFGQYQCRGCHEWQGTGGQVGPSLDGVGERRRDAYVQAILRDPSSVIPGTAMKDFDLWDEEILVLAAFLATPVDGMKEVTRHEAP